MLCREKIRKLFLAVTVLLVSGKLYGVPYELSYGGRLVEAGGKPVDGPIDIGVKFFRSASGADEVGAVAVPNFTNVTLSEGVFQVVINLTATEFHIIFNETDAVWIQITDITHARAYPRQKFSAVPYALKVPVDGEAITYNVDGELTLGRPGRISLKALNTDYAVSLKSPDNQGANQTLTLPGSAGTAGQFLKSDGTGNMVWDTISGGYPAGDATKVGYLTVTAATNLDQIRADTTTNNAKTSYPSGDSTKVGFLTVTGATNLDQMRSDVTANNAKVSYPSGDQTKMGYLSVTQGVDLDAMETKLNGITAGAEPGPKALCADGEFLAGNATTTCRTATQIVGDGGGVTTSDTGTVTGTMILNGTITNADINDVAAGKVTGLGGAAMLNVGSTTGTVAAGDHGHSNATTGAAGFISAADKTKLDGIAAGAGVDTNAKTLCADGEFLRGETTTTCKTSTQILSDGGGITTSDTGTVTSTMIANGTIADADISGTAAIAGTKVTPNFGSQNVSTTGSVTAASFSGDGSALTNLPGGLTSCPAGFTMIGTAGKRGTFCVDTTQRTAATYQNAIQACHNLSLTGATAALCDYKEWLVACNSGLATGMTGDYEWVAEFTEINFAIVAGQSACSSLTNNGISNTSPFRCCVR